MGTTNDWRAESYHRVSEPQHRWGVEVLSRIELRGDETVIDAGCGTGRLTAELMKRLPNGRVIALDRSPAMLEVARRELAPYGARVRFEQADLEQLTLHEEADVVFSTATFHWVHDHDALFRGLCAALRVGGRLVAQCGGAGNLARLHRRAEARIATPRYAKWFEDWREPWNFETPDPTKARLYRVGFRDAKAWLHDEPTTFPDADAYREFVRTVVLRNHLHAIKDPRDADTFLDASVFEASRDTPPFTLDYVRLNMEAVRAR